MNVFRTDGWVKTAQGPAVPGAQIYVCTQPANIAALPPTPLANIFSDSQGLVPITQPIITDGFGHYDFYAAAGVYTVIVGLAGLIQQVYPDQSIGGAGGSGGTALAIEVNGTPTADQLLLNLTGAGSVSIAADDVGNVTITGGSASFPSGANVATLPIYSTGSSGLEGFTVVLKIPANYVQAFASALRVGVVTTSVTGLVLNRASVATTLPGTTAWVVNPTTLVFPAGSFASANAQYLSNAVTIAFDTQHDLYIMLYWDPTSAGGNAYATIDTSSATGFVQWTGFSGWISGDHSHDGSASLLQSLGGGGKMFCIQQVITA